MSEISKEELGTEIENILKDADLMEMTTKRVRLTLEKKYGVSLDDRKKEIDKMVMDYVNKKNDDDENDEEDDEEEEEVKPKVKKETKSRSSRNSNKRTNVSDDDDDEEEEEEKKSPKKKKGKAKDGAKKPKRPGGGYTRVCKLSPALSELVGSDQMARHEVVKKIWQRIKEKNLYDPKNKLFAVCDENMYKVFGIKRFRAFGMMKYLKEHFVD